MIIKPGIIFIWTGAHLAIPSGWERVVAMDDFFPKGAESGLNPNETGGSSTHSHTSPAHTHSISAHTHTISLSPGQGSSASTGLNTTACMLAHTHNSFSSGVVINGSVSSVSATYGSVSNNPPFSKVIFVSPIEETNTLPAGIVALSDSDILRGFKLCDGTEDTPNLNGKYLLGSSAGEDAGAIGGSTTNVHSLVHAHTTSHGHATATSPGPNQTNARSQSGSVNVVWGHAHDVTPNVATPSSSDNPNISCDEVVEPAYTKLLAILNSEIQEIPLGAIGLWLGSLENIPPGWVLENGEGYTAVDMRGRHLKATALVSEIGDTGGSNTHSHSAKSHSHAINHAHTCPNVSHSGGSAVRDSGQATTVQATYHTVSTDSVNMTLESVSTTADSANNEPSFRTVAFIKLISRFQGKTFLLNFIH